MNSPLLSKTQLTLPSEAPRLPPLRWSDIRAQVGPTLALGGPVVLGQLGFMLMNAVDTAMVKALGAQATAAVGLGGAIGSLAFMFGFGMLLGLDRVVSFAFGAGRLDHCYRAMIQGLWIATFLSLPLTAITFGLAGFLPQLGIGPEVAPAASAYLKVLALSTWPGLLFTALRQSLQATGDTRFPSAVMLIANLVNVAANYLLIFGFGPIPALGIVGAGWATFASRAFMLLVLAVYTWRRGLGVSASESSVSELSTTESSTTKSSTTKSSTTEFSTTESSTTESSTTESPTTESSISESSTSTPRQAQAAQKTKRKRPSLSDEIALTFAPDLPQLKELFLLGLPVAFHLVLESGVFTMTTVLAARLGTVELAAHHVVLLIASLTFMVPLGLSAAAAVRVGQALGRRDPVGARNAGWAAVVVAVGVMGGIAGLLLAFRGSFLQIFAADAEVLAIGSRLLILVAIFQMADGAQITLSAALRGAGDTRIPAIANFFGHWALGLPLGATLCFVLGWGTFGLWTGLATGLAIVATLLALWWRHRINGQILRDLSGVG